MNTTPSEAPLHQDLVYAVRYYLHGWRGLAALAITLAVPALWIGGPWLIAAGAVPLLISLAPCLVMCALGLCMMKSCSKNAAASDAANAVPTTGSTPAVTSAAVDAPGGAVMPPRA